MSKILNGKTIVITRPLHQAGPLSQQIQLWGGQTVLFPTLTIEPAIDFSQLLSLSTRLKEFDFAIFLSANSVTYASSLFDLSWTLPTIAIGPGTAKALQERKVPVNWIPESYDSEGILALPVLKNIDGKKILIFCGENSRSFLKNGLIEAGAVIEEFICYRRECPQVDGSFALRQWQRDGVDLIISTSLESLENLWHIVGGINDNWLLRVPLLVISPGMVQFAQHLGFQIIFLAEGAGDIAIGKALSRIG